MGAAARAHAPHVQLARGRSDGHQLLECARRNNGRLDAADEA
jgi:hypothetical protein